MHTLGLKLANSERPEWKKRWEKKAVSENILVWLEIACFYPDMCKCFSALQFNLSSQHCAVLSTLIILTVQGIWVFRILDVIH